MTEENCLDIPEEKISEAENAAAEEARKLSIPEFCQEVEARVQAQEEVSAEVKSAVSTLTGLVQHMHMAIHQYVYSRDQLQDLLNISISVTAPTEPAAPTMQ